MMTLGFVEARKFMQVHEEYFAGDASSFALQQTLLGNPKAGSVIPGCGGLRKIRWPDPRRSKGKRGGLRIICLHVPDVQRIVFLDVYDKDEADDLTPEQRKEFAADAEKIRLEVQYQNFFWPGG